MIDNVSYGTEPNGAAITPITLEPNNFRIGTDGWKPARSWVFWERECNGSSVLVNPENDAWEIALPDWTKEQLFTWEAAIRETRKASKRIPTTTELQAVLRTMPVRKAAGWLVGGFNVRFPWFRETASGEIVWSGVFEFWWSEGEDENGSPTQNCLTISKASQWSGATANVWRPGDAARWISVRCVLEKKRCK